MAMSGLSVLGAAPQNISTSDSLSNLLVVILDLNASWWSEQLDGEDPQKASNGVHDSHTFFPLASAIDHVLVFINSYMLIHPNNRVVVLGCLRSRSYFLHPPGGVPEEAMINDSRAESFRIVDHNIVQEIRRIMSEALNDPDAAKDSARESVFVGALSRSLCYIHRAQREAPKGQAVQARIVVIETGLDSSSHYMHFINSVFTAQKMNVKIDACVLGEDSILLQQAVDLTGGIYLKVEHPGGLVQLLNSLFVIDASERSKMMIPEKVQVDYRAACFCHQKLIEVGWVCSVCLSVFCAFSPMCSTCQTTFKFMTGMKKRKPFDSPSSSVPSPSTSGLKRTRSDADMNGRS